MSSIEALSEALSPHAGEMIALARSSIRRGLTAGEPPAVRVSAYPATLRETMACFVTLRVSAELRGCIGTLRASRPLVEDLSHNAFKAAFRDPRFDPLTPAEFVTMRLEISVLGTPAMLDFDDENELIELLEPGLDGLILDDGARRALFLPQVWDTLPAPAEFLRCLKEKVGLPAAPLAAGVRAQRFRVVKLEEGTAG